jgi:acyl CoA:acetate/3-ketoacid CoA transferase beta subunit
VSERAWTPDEQLVWCLARRVRAGDVLVVGVATPLAAAAAHLARAVLEPDVTIIEAAAVDVAEHDVADPFLRPDDVARSAVGVLTQVEILDAVQRGRISLQFVSPAQVDGRGALNTSRVPDGRAGSAVCRAGSRPPTSHSSSAGSSPIAPAIHRGSSATGSTSSPARRAASRRS